jgi:hypothetical protein
MGRGRRRALEKVCRHGEISQHLADASQGSSNAPSKAPSWGTFSKFFPSLSRSPPRAVVAQSLDLRQDSTVAIASKLQCASTVQEIRDILQNADGSLDIKTFSQAAFAALLENRVPYHVLEEFLFDEGLNVREARNLSALLEHAFAEEIDERRYAAILGTVRMSIRAGLADIQEMVHVAERISDLVKGFVHGCESPSAGWPGLLHSAYNGIWEAIQTSSIILEDRRVLAGVLLEILTGMRETIQADRFRLLLACYIWPHPALRGDPLRNSQSYGRMLAHWVQHAAESTRASTENTHVTMTSRKLLALLEAIPGDSFRDRRIVWATRLLSLQTKWGHFDRSGLETLDFWLEFVRQHYQPTTAQSPSEERAGPVSVPTEFWTQIYVVIAPNVKPIDLTNHFGAMDPVEASWVILRYFVSAHYKKRKLEGMDSERQFGTLWGEEIDAVKRIRRNFLENISLVPAHRQSEWQLEIFSRLAIVVARTSQMTRTPLADILQLIRRLFGTEALLSKLWVIREEGIRLPARTIETVLRDILEEFESSFRGEADVVYFAQPPPLLAAMRMKGTHNIDEMLELMDDAEDSNWETLDRLRNDVVHLITRSFAYSKYTSDRVAYRRVQTCLRYCQLRGYFLKAAMSRALIHAGLNRPFDAGQGVPKRRLVGILRSVEKIEGNSKASSLVEYWNRASRRLAAQTAHSKISEGTDLCTQDLQGNMRTSSPVQKASFKWTRRYSLPKGRRYRIMRLAVQPLIDRGS